MFTNRFRGYSSNCYFNGWVYGEAHVKGSRPHIHVGEENISVEVDPSTISAFSGLLDRNGREIYEGDIVRYFAINYSDFPRMTSIAEVWDVVVFRNGGFVLNSRPNYLVAFLTRELNIGCGLDNDFWMATNRDLFSMACPSPDGLYLVEVVANVFEESDAWDSVPEDCLHVKLREEDE